jgi:hypothetical protein
MGCMLDLTPQGPVVRPILLLSFLWRRIPITDQVISVRVRPFENEREARKLLSSGQYAPGGVLQQAGSDVVACQTSHGVLEFAVRRPDVPLMLHFFNRITESSTNAAPSDDV